MALIGMDNNPPPTNTTAASLIARITLPLLGGSDAMNASRLAAGAFLIRTAGALLAYLSQVLLAQWMGSFQFGVYVYVWTWVLLLSGIIDVGLSSASLRLIPEYTERKLHDLLRGFESGSRWLAFALACAIALVCAAIVYLMKPWLADYEITPLYIGCLALPICGLMQIQTGIARAHNWVQLAQLPTYIFRHLLIVGLMGAAYAAAFPTDAVTGILISVVSLWIIGAGQLLILNRRLAEKTEPGAKSYAVKGWLTLAFPMLMVDGFYLLLTYSSVLLVQLLQSPREVAIYYAAEKTLSVVAFVHFAVTQTTTHKFSEFYVAKNREKLAATLSHATKMIFWPSLAATGLVLIAGVPMLWLFGREFVAGYPLLFIFAVGLMARAAVGPLAAFLNMVCEQRACAAVFAGAFGINVLLCLTLIPIFGIAGAAVSISAALVVESASLFFLTKRKAGLHGFIWRPRGVTAGGR
ncbi:MAG TPA: oligosaccharide flippase family protein [Xanthobacteraceae bacterium]|nr:oligosaccharide flippase family protein [Xanthobacteraceae bacterium]